MNCPKCSGVFETKSYEGVEVDICSTCSGVWLDRGELTQIISRLDESFSPSLIKSTIDAGFAGVPKSEKDQKVQCPHCKIPMNSVNYNYGSGIIIDKCDDHGIWLDKGELEGIQIIREKGQDNLKSNAGEIKKLLREVKDTKKAVNSDIIENGPSSVDAINLVISSILELIP